MRYTCIKNFQYEEYNERVTDVVLTKDHLAVDWLEGGNTKAGLLAKSTDGVFYEGFMGFPSPDLDGKVEFRVYRAKNGEVLLFGKWWRLDASLSSSWLIHLAPPVKVEAKTATSRSKTKSKPKIKPKPSRK